MALVYFTTVERLIIAPATPWIIPDHEQWRMPVMQAVIAALCAALPNLEIDN